MSGRTQQKDPKKERKKETTKQESRDSDNAKSTKSCAGHSRNATHLADTQEEALAAAGVRSRGTADGLLTGNEVN